jgi:hypothetical protein
MGHDGNGSLPPAPLVAEPSPEEDVVVLASFETVGSSLASMTLSSQATKATSIEAMKMKGKKWRMMTLGAGTFGTATRRIADLSQVGIGAFKVRANDRRSLLGGARVHPVSVWRRSSPSHDDASSTDSPLVPPS